MLEFLKKNIFIIILSSITLFIGFLTFLTFIDRSFIELNQNNLQYLLIVNIFLLILLFVFIFLEEDLSELVEGISFQPSVLSWAFATALAMALIAGLPPAVGAMRLKVVDALRKD